MLTLQYTHLLHCNGNSVYSFSGNICFKFSAFCLCSVYTSSNYSDPFPVVNSVSSHLSFVYFVCPCPSFTNPCIHTCPCPVCTSLIPLSCLFLPCPVFTSLVMSLSSLLLPYPVFIRTCPVFILPCPLFTSLVLPLSALDLSLSSLSGLLPALAQSLSLLVLSYTCPCPVFIIPCPVL